MLGGSPIGTPEADDQSLLGERVGERCVQGATSSGLVW